MTERGLKISQIAALLTAAPPLAALVYLLIALERGEAEIVYGMLFVFLSVTGLCAAIAYAVSLIWLFIYWIKNGSVGNRALTLAAVLFPAILFAALAISFSP